MTLADLSPWVLPYSVTSYWSIFVLPICSQLDILGSQLDYIGFLHLDLPLGGIQFLQTQVRKISLLAALVTVRNTRMWALKGLILCQGGFDHPPKGDLLSKPSREVKGPNWSSGLNLEVSLQTLVGPTASEDPNGLSIKPVKKKAHFLAKLEIKDFAERLITSP